MPLNIVLIEPEIPNNTGNIGRLALATGSKLHLVKPFGFEINDTRLKRAGLDYWKHLEVVYYNSIHDFFQTNNNAKMVFLSSHGQQNHWVIPFEENLFLVFAVKIKRCFICLSSTKEKHDHNDEDERDEEEISERAARGVVNVHGDV